MKKTISLILTLVLCLFLCACGREKQSIETQGMQDNQSSNEGNATQNSQNNSDPDQSSNTVYLLSKHTSYDDDNTKLDIKYFEYDERGRITSYSCDHQKITFTYDEANQLIEMYRFLEGEAYNRVELSYEDGELVNEKIYDKRLDQPQNITYGYSYSDQGNKIKTVTVYDNIGNLVYSKEYEYNSDHQKVRETLIRKEKESTITYEYDSEGHMVKKKGDNGYYQVSYKGTAVEQIILVANEGEIWSTVQCSHDQNGNIKKCVRYDKNKFPNYREEFEYQSFKVYLELQPEFCSEAFLTMKYCYFELDSIQ